MSSSELNVVIVGGSVAGLMAGVVIKSLGHHVCILEAREPASLKAEAAGLSLSSQAQELMATYVSAEAESYGFRNLFVQFLGPDAQVLQELPNAISIVTSSWTVVYERLKAKFLEQATNDPNDSLNTGTRVTDMSYKESQVSLTYVDVDGKEHSLSPDLVIAADGSRSILRTKVMPSVQPTYAGCVAWRGCVPESAIPDALNATLEYKMLIARAEYGYFLTYLTPGLNGSMEPGKRLLDWAWYELSDESSPEHERIMTDSQGHRHNRTVPKGKLAPDVWKDRVEIAEKLLPAPFAEIVAGAITPFITTVTGFDSSKAAFWDGKLLFLGEAFTQFRPHMGLSSNLSALQALSLARVLKKELTLEEWEKDCVAYGQEFTTRSNAFGHFGLTGQYPEGYVPL